MSLITLAPGETSIPKIVLCLRQLVQYVQGLIIPTGTVTSIATAGLASGGPITATGTVTVAITTTTNSLGADVALNNTAAYFDGPSIAQGTSGTWYASGTVSLGVNAGDGVDVKLWDGTTIISSMFVRAGTGAGATFAALSGVLSSPAGNIRISAKNITSTTGAISFNSTGNSKDSTLTVLRIA